jgi:putative CocE/NonD family hydrolase
MAIVTRLTAFAVLLAATVSVVAVAQTVQTTDAKSARAAAVSAQRAQDAAAEAAAKAGPAARLVAPGQAAAASATAAPPSPSASYPDYSAYTTVALEAAMQKKAIIERKLLMPMRDGVGLSTDIFRPKGAAGPLPTIFIRTPYNMNVLQGSQQRQVMEALDRGYAVIMQNERGRYFSEGKYEILGYPRTDGYDALTWIAKQSWSNGKVGTLGCSSSAEWQLQLAAMHHPAHAAMIPMSAGAGIGRVGPFEEQGNWYRGGVPRMLFIPWLYNTDNPLRAEIPAGLDAATRQYLSVYSDLDPRKPTVNWARQTKYLPVSQMLSSLGEPPGTFEQLIARLPDDPAWFKGGLYHDNEKWGVPALWFDAWYDVSIGPNLALYNEAAKNGVDANVRDNQYAVVGPNVHCDYNRYGPGFRSGDRDLGDTTFDTNGAIWAFFDRFLKDQPDGFPASTPKVRYYQMGENAWKTADRWPPKEAGQVKLYLHSGGRANSMYGDGRADFVAPKGEEPADRYVYDPMNPVQTIGGGDCCNGGVVVPGAYDQRPVESRHDVLVYTSEPLKQPIAIAGFVDAVLHVSSDAKDTDFAVKLVDVDPDGVAYIIDDTIFRARFREGYGKEVFMQKGKTYEIRPTPMTTANTFLPGHRIRVEITSSNFPKFVRNLNTGGRNEFEKTGLLATNQLRHSKAEPTYLVLPVIK